MPLRSHFDFKCFGGGGIFNAGGVDIFFLECIRDGFGQPERGECAGELGVDRIISNKFKRRIFKFSAPGINPNRPIAVDFFVVGCGRDAELHSAAGGVNFDFA